MKGITKEQIAKLQNGDIVICEEVMGAQGVYLTEGKEYIVNRRDRYQIIDDEGDGLDLNSYMNKTESIFVLKENEELKDILREVVECKIMIGKRSFIITDSEIKLSNNCISREELKQINSIIERHNL